MSQNLFFHQHAGICGKLNNNYLCKKCEKNLDSQAKFEILENKNGSQNFNKHLYIFKYEGIIREILLDYKFNGKSYLYKTIVNFLLKNEKFFQILKSYDTIVPVPISSKRKKERGYNQCELMAREIAKLVNIEYNNKCLYKVKNITEQSKLNKEEREKNIKDVYKIKKSYKLTNKKVILLDDIFTTGSTVNECCKILKQEETQLVDVLTIAKD